MHCKTFARVLILGCFASLFQNAISQVHLPRFRHGDKVCFVGNSITQSGGYHHYIYLYYATRFPDEQLTFFNCGVGGDIASGIAKRLDEDVFIHNPNHLVLMVGMNDVRRDLYSKGNEGNAAVEAQKVEALKRYRHDTDELVRRLKDHSSNVILVTPSIYDQTANLDAENMYGSNDALRVCSDHIKQLSAKYNTGLVDFWTVLNELNIREQRADPGFTIVGPDRIHPQSTGHLVMAYQFLKTMGAPADVARIAIEGNLEQSTAKSTNCRISGLVRNRRSVSFKCTERSLPFPVPEGAGAISSLGPFHEDLNNEILSISGLRSGTYELAIDDRAVGTYSSADLQRGVNLALNKNTPQYRQALRVLEKCALIKSLQGKLRLLKRVEYRELGDDLDNLDIDSVNNVLAGLLATKYQNDRYEFNKKLFDNYAAVKPIENEIPAIIASEIDSLYLINKCVEHAYSIRRKR